MNNTYYQRPNNSGKNNNTNNQQQGYEQQYNRYYQPNYRQQQSETYGSPVVRKQSALKDFAINIILVVLSISFVIAIFTLGAELKDINRYYEKDANSFWWAYESGRYADSIKDRYENYMNDVKETAELKQCYAVSEYFEAASLYKAAVFTGKSDTAQEYLKIMELSREEMGDMDYLAEDINVKLGLEDLAE